MEPLEAMGLWKGVGDGTYSVDLYPSVTLPLFITKAKRLLMESDVFFAFLGAIVALLLLV
jgi:hypothetical protein